MFTTEHKTCMESLRYVMGVLRILLSREDQREAPGGRGGAKNGFSAQN
jgi:hypothetical protein